MENINGYYDKGFTTRVDSDGSVRVESQHFAETVSDEALFVWPGRKRSLNAIARGVERAKKRLQKQEDRLLAVKAEFGNE